MMPIVRLDSDHLADVIALHHHVIANMPPGSVASETDRFFADHMSDCGQIFGAFDGGRLIAYSVLGLPRPGDANFGTDHDLPVDALAQVAHIDGVGVLPEFRGNGWHRRMIDHRMDVARTLDRPIALSTVAPANLASVHNLLAAGMRIAGLIPKFGGDRFLVRADIGDVAKNAKNARVDQWCLVTDKEQCQALISDGFEGVAMRVRASGPDKGAEIGWVRHA